MRSETRARTLKAVKTVLLTIGVYYLCWIPLGVWILWDLVSPDVDPLDGLIFQQCRQWYCMVVWQLYEWCDLLQYSTKLQTDIDERHWYQFFKFQVKLVDLTYLTQSCHIMHDYSLTVTENSGNLVVLMALTVMYGISDVNPMTRCSRLLVPSNQ